MYPHGYHKVDKQVNNYLFSSAQFISKELVLLMSINYLRSWKRKICWIITPFCMRHCWLPSLMDAPRPKSKRPEKRIKSAKQSPFWISKMSSLAMLVKPTTSWNQSQPWLKTTTLKSSESTLLNQFSMFIVNAPMLFTGIWTIVKMWIDDKTKEKIKILGSSYKKELLEFIDA